MVLKQQNKNLPPEFYYLKFKNTNIYTNNY